MLFEIGSASDAWGIPETSALCSALLPLQHGGNSKILWDAPEETEL